MTALDLHDIDPERRAAVAIDLITVAQRQAQRANRRPPALTAREALAALHSEANFVWTCAGNIAAGVELTDADLALLSQSMRWIDLIYDEVLL